MYTSFMYKTILDAMLLPSIPLLTLRHTSKMTSDHLGQLLLVPSQEQSTSQPTSILTMPS